MTTNLHTRYFTEYLPSIMGQRMIEDADDFTACIELVVTDDNSHWRLGIENGRLIYVGQEGAAPQCRFESDAQTLVELITAKTCPTNAFMEMRVEVTGDLDLAMHVSFLMEEFFQRFPYKPEP